MKNLYLIFYLAVIYSTNLFSNSTNVLQDTDFFKNINTEQSVAAEFKQFIKKSNLIETNNNGVSIEYNSQNEKKLLNNDLLSFKYSASTDAILSTNALTFSQINNRSDSIRNYFFNLGFGVGLDYGGIFGINLALRPVQFFSIFGAAGFDLNESDLGWNLGGSIHLVSNSSSIKIRPIIKLMYGVNRGFFASPLTFNEDLKQYNKSFVGWTPGIGLRFMTGKNNSKAIEFNLNYPINPEFNKYMDEVKNNEPSYLFIPLPFTMSLGYHFMF